MQPDRAVRTWCLRSAAGGVLIWLLYLILDRASGWNYITIIERLLLLAILVFTPLALALVQQWPAHQAPNRILGWACRLQPLAALLVAVAFTQPTGNLAASLTFPWLLCAGMVALAGLAMRRTAHGAHPPHELVLTIGMLYLPIGAAWLLISRLGLRPLAFPDVIVLLTAVHFHYTGFAVPVITAMTGRFLARQQRVVPLYPWIAGAIVGATPLIAAGITLAPWLEALGVLLIFLAVCGLAGVLIIHVLPRLSSAVARGLLTIAACAMVVAILPALLYGTGELLGRSFITIPRMVQIHGFTNAFGFVACGFSGWLVAGTGTGGQFGPCREDSIVVKTT